MFRDPNIKHNFIKKEKFVALKPEYPVNKPTIQHLGINLI